MVRVGNNVTFRGASSGATDRGGLQFGSAQQSFNKSQKKAQSAVQAVLVGLGIWGWADVRKDFSITGNRRRRATLNMTGNYRTARSAFGLASARVRLRIYLFDKTKRRVVDRFTLLDKTSSGLGFTTKNSSYNRTLSGTLYPGRKYRVGVNVRTWATADTVATATSDVHPSGNFNGYIKYDRAKLVWR